MLIILLIYVDNLGFIALSNLIKKLIRFLEKVAKTILALKIGNAVIYNIAKIKTLLFSRLY